MAIINKTKFSNDGHEFFTRLYYQGVFDIEHKAKSHTNTGAFILRGLKWMESFM